ncbi:unnamed protein product, partial [Ectocarpus sp. 4 AP-2014]
PRGLRPCPGGSTKSGEREHGIDLCGHWNILQSYRHELDSSSNNQLEGVARWVLPGLRCPSHIHGVEWGGYSAAVDLRNTLSWVSKEGGLIELTNSAHIRRSMKPGGAG